ncbi:MAG: c-type cytochrome [Sulfitobacter sp.]|nr:c-type cytochrome [Sulfitobacter sp.]
MRTVLKVLLVCALVGAGLAWILTRPAALDEGYAAGHQPDVDAGKKVFVAAGCASCHAAPEASGEEKLVLAGGYAFASPYGTFYAPNISPSDAGIGGWSLPEFARAVTQGVSPEGQHYYPAFPYTSYIRMRPQDVSDLHAYMRTLPTSDTPSKAHEIGFPYNIRRTLGGWKLLYLRDDDMLADPLSEELERGRYLVEALAHCAECHTPRDALGGLQRARWMAGAPNPSGKGQIPNITPAKLDWSESDLVYYFESGFTPDYDSVGGSMAAVVTNLSKLTEADRIAIARYLKAIPPAE